MLWGGYAKKKGKGINKKKHKVFESPHPSPLAFNRNPEAWLSTKQFTRANEFLAAADPPADPIDWCSIMKRPTTSQKKSFC